MPTVNRDQEGPMCNETATRFVNVDHVGCSVVFGTKGTQQQGDTPQIA
jgi:hypothetical protein